MPDQPSDTPHSPEQRSAELLNAGQLLHQAGKLEDAQQLYQLVLETEPDNPHPYHRLGLLALEIEQFDTARDLIQMAIERDANQAVFHRDLGTAFTGLQADNKAITSYRRAQKLEPEDATTHYQLGLALKRHEEPREAATHLEKAITLGLRNAQVFAELADTFNVLFRFNEAEAMAKAAITLEPLFPLGPSALALTLFAQGRFEEARIWAQRTLSLMPEDVDAHIRLAQIECDAGEHIAAIQHARKALELEPDNGKVYHILCVAYLAVDRWDEAEKIINEGLKLAPASPDLIAMKATVLERNGKHQEAFDLIQPMINRREGLKPTTVLIYARLAKRYGKERQAIALLEALHKAEQLPLTIHYTSMNELGKLYDGIGQYDRAFACFEKANSLKPHHYDSAEHERSVTHIIEWFTPERLQALPRASHGSRRPIFIVGMPRSGTSLTERILARHSQVHGGGELQHIEFIVDKFLPELLHTEKGFPDYLETLAEATANQAAQVYLDYIDSLVKHNEPHVTDKMPMNFIPLGLIALLFPQAKIIHCTRNPMATGLSCFIENFASSHALGFTQNLRTIGHYYRQYEKLMQHWHKTLSIPIYDLSYEKLVSEPDEQIRGLLEFCELPWEEACLSPHKAKEASTTASYNQVRNPINTQSIERWRHYEKHLKPLKDALEGEE